MRKDPAKVVALVFPGVVAFDLATPAQVFGHRAERRRYAFAVATPRPGEVPTSTGFSVLVAAGLDELDGADTVVVPGHVDLEREWDAGALAALRAAHARGARIASVCTGAFVLAAAGLLDGRRATTHWHDAPRLAAWHPAVDVDPDVLYVDEGDVLTSAGVAAGIDLCLHLVRLDHGEDVANAVARRIVVARHRSGGQAQFVERPLPASEAAGLEATRAWALERLREPLTVAAMARHALMSERSFARRFRAETGTTPLRWLIDRRVAPARRLLERTDLPVEAVAAESGFGTAASLRDHFGRAVRTPPTAYRRAFRGRQQP
ncbi:MAG TPA: helix-turn-helix domain-containing protein [Solirubrobacteraceae bacterium]|nr:helix-turn-helix domain-containing protein [Solirubrobacteraceae bacterium]